MNMKMNYGEEAELICRALADRGAKLLVTHYSQDSEYYRHECEGLPFAQIADNLWQVEDSLLHIEYEGQRRWLRFIFGNSFGELVGDYSCSPYDKPNQPIDNLIESVVMGPSGYKGDEHNAPIVAFGEAYYDLSFREVTHLMDSLPIHYTSVMHCWGCGGITNPTPETGPFKPRQLCDCVSDEEE